MALDFFAGCVGGCAGVVVGHPFDTIKVRLQTQDPARPRYSGTLNCLRTIVKEESARGLYKGVTSPLAGVSVVNALVFGVYGAAQRHAGHAGLDASSLSSHAVAGAAAGAAQSVACSPVELAKTRLQLQGDGALPGTKYRGPLDCLRQVWRAEGVRGTFRGFCPTLLREVPACAVYFASFEWMTRGDQQAPTWLLLLAGGLAGTISWVMVYPVDVVKSRVQADGMLGNGERRYRSAIHCFRSSLAAEGSRFLFRGLTSTILRAFPTNAATFATVTWTMRLLQDDDLQMKVQQAQQVQQQVQQQVHHVQEQVQQQVHHVQEQVQQQVQQVQQHVHIQDWLNLHCHLTLDEPI